MKVCCKISIQALDRPALEEFVSDPAAGALVIFDGVVRDNSRGRRVLHLEYDCYAAMAERQIQVIAEQAGRNFPILGIAIAHRTGRLQIGESSVIIAVSSAHRSDAFRACMFAIDTLKKSVPIWKREFYKDGSCWIEGEAAVKPIEAQ